MGCNTSTEAQVLLVRKPLEVPPIPGWNGQVSSILPVQVEFQLHHSMNGSVTTSTDTNMDHPFMNCILAENTAGDGFRLKSIFLPFYPVPSRTSDSRVYPETLEKYGGEEISSMAMYSKAMCIFQKSRYDSESFQETLNLSVKITMDGQMSNANAWKRVQGHEEIISKLIEAGVYV